MTSQSAPVPTVREVTALFSRTGLGIVAGGNVFDTPGQVLRWVKRHDAKVGFAVTVLHWENCPAGFVPPPAT